VSCCGAQFPPSPAEAENVLAAYPKVGDVAFVGVPHEEMGEEVKGVVVPVPGVEPSDNRADELIAHCQSHIAKYKCPRSIDFVDGLPRQDNGKLDKQKIRERDWSGAVRAI
jgi:long-chain acyl-CoA synthetase